MLCGTTIDKTGKKDVPVKATSHKKVRVSVCLSALPNGIYCIRECKKRVNFK